MYEAEVVVHYNHALHGHCFSNFGVFFFLSSLFWFNLDAFVRYYVTGCPIDPLTVLEPRDQEFDVVQERRATDFEDPKL